MHFQFLQKKYQTKPWNICSRWSANWFSDFQGPQYSLFNLDLKSYLMIHRLLELDFCLLRNTVGMRTICSPPVVAYRTSLQDKFVKYIFFKDIPISGIITHKVIVKMLTSERCFRNSTIIPSKRRVYQAKRRVGATTAYYISLLF